MLSKVFELILLSKLNSYFCTTDYQFGFKSNHSTDSVRKQDPGIQELEEDGSQWDGRAALQGRGCGICGHVGQLCGE